MVVEPVAAVVPCRCNSPSCIDVGGKITLRRQRHMFKIGIGRTHARTRVVCLINDLDVRIVHAITGKPPGGPKGPREPEHPNARPFRFGVVPSRCLIRLGTPGSTTWGARMKSRIRSVPNSAIVMRARRPRGVHELPTIAHHVRERLEAHDRKTRMLPDCIAHPRSR